MLASPNAGLPLEPPILPEPRRGRDLLQNPRPALLPVPGPLPGLARQRLLPRTREHSSSPISSQVSPAGHKTNLGETGLGHGGQK